MVSTEIEMESFNKLLKQYPIDSAQAIISEGKGGANNTTKYIESMGHKYVMRIYETHKDIERVLVEHEILEELNKDNRLTFQVPQLIRASNGQTALRLPDGSGRIVAISKYLEGINPSFNNDKSIFSFGQTTGLLMNALNNIKIKRSYAYKPYYEIEHTHPQCPPDYIAEWCNHPPQPFQDLSVQLQWIAEQIYCFQSQVSWLRQLPHQLIHGDLNASNVLMDNDRIINAILDFEFATNDLRVMEVAVCLSELMVGEMNESAIWDKLNIYIKGLRTTIHLNELELEALPILVQLRRLDVFIHFLGRYHDGVDEADVLRRQIVNAVSRPDWIKAGGPKLIALCNHS